MSNNTINHVSDASVYVTFDPTDTQWPATFTNVQQALGAIGSWARTDVGLPNAAPGLRGIAAIATEAMIDDGTDTETIVTPALLAYRLQNPHASQTMWGYTRYATDAEATTVTNDLVSVTPRSVDVIFNNRHAQETVWGSTKLSTTAQATAGIDDTTAMTPLKVKQAISSLVPVQSNATETDFGLVQLATIAEVRAGTIRDGFAISPYTFTRLNATEADLGVVRLASQAEVNAGSDDTKAITSLKLANVKGSGSSFGLVKLSTEVNAGLANTALSAGANVVPSNRDSAIYNGGLYQGSISSGNKYQTWSEVEATLPIGCMVIAAFNSDYYNLYIANGRALNKNEYPILFGRIGYTYGGSGDWFNLPDMRGLVPRGFDAGRNVDPGRGFATFQDDAMQRITADWTMDDQAVDCNYPPQGATWADSKGSVNYDASSDNRNWRAYRMHFDSARQTKVAHETRMKNLAINYIIRVR